MEKKLYNFFIDKLKKQKTKKKKISVLFNLIWGKLFFSPKDYLELNQDVYKSGSEPWYHFVCYGSFENRVISKNSIIIFLKSCIDKHTFRHFFTYLKAVKLFNQTDYLEMNKDVAKANINPWIHYLRYGIFQYRPYMKMKYKKYGLFYSILRFISKLVYNKKIIKNSDKKILLHIHLFYADSWKEIREYILNIASYNHVDIIVTYTDELIDKNIIENIKQFNNTTAIYIPNKGFDIGPFLHVIHDIPLENYDIVIHMHSKGINGVRPVYKKCFINRDWFLQLYRGVLGVFNVHKCIDLFNDKSTGIVCAKNLIFVDNKERQNLVKKFGEKYQIFVPDDYSFVGGFCLAMRASMLTEIKKLDLTISNFHESERNIFTIAHALERLIPISITNQGGSIKGIHTLYKKNILVNHDIMQKKEKRHKRNILFLENKGFSMVRPLNLDMNSGIGCSFYEGIINGKICFIKMNGDKEIYANEYNMSKLCSSKSKFFLPPVKYHNGENKRFIAYEKLSGYDLRQYMEIGLTDKQINKIKQDLLSIKDFLVSNNLLHRDIRPQNIFIAQDKTYLIDMQFMVKCINGKYKELNLKNKNSILDVLGDKYKKGVREWDDAYSINLIIDEISSL